MDPLSIAASSSAIAGLCFKVSVHRGQKYGDYRVPSPYNALSCQGKYAKTPYNYRLLTVKGNFTLISGLAVISG
jgi:hypothetical protein